MTDSQTNPQDDNRLRQRLADAVNQATDFVVLPDSAPIYALEKVVQAEVAAVLEHVKQDYVLQPRDVFLTTADTDPFGDDPMAERAIRIRNKLRKDIAADIDTELARLNQTQGGEQ